MFNTSSFSIRSRLIFSFSTMTILLLATAMLVLYSLDKSRQGMLFMYEHSVVPAQQLSGIQKLIFRSRLRIADSLVNPSEGAIQKSTNEVEQNIAGISGLWQTYAANPFRSDDEKVQMEKFSAAQQAFIDDGLKPMITALRAHQLSQADDIMWAKVDPLYVPAQDALGELMKILTEDARQDYDETSSRFDSTRNVVIALSVAGLVLAIWMGFRLTLSIVRPLEAAVELADAVADGDLTRTVEVKSRDEVGRMLQALKRMNEKLFGIVSGVRQVTETINASSRELALGNADLSSRTEEQASTLEETAASMEELTSTVRQNADNAKQANQLAANASDIAIRGGDVVDKVVHTMASISTSSQKIVDIISVIEGIAFQTNILALNAAVEAARAGEQGRGFAVVAGEVRNLAQRSATAAREIKILIGNSVGTVETGSKLVDQAGATMQEIVQAVKRVTDIMAEIAAASNEQSAGIEQVNQAITQMDDVTQQNAALVEEASASAEAMKAQADVLMQSVGSFKLNVTHMAWQESDHPSMGNVRVLSIPARTPVSKLAA